ncbi:AraC family transcriptional regulator [Taibaiella sp. KBW10]|uniref:AraC family transcriptional regulator n=1 Tax=Taibaiella sp. KBW10 TaxID=2153357 RepID=UPI000F5AE432|nr:AraC family transcriptional regulator [Taibaiella sp. KBW10]RQO31811.1 AraC family transcriptional regulator [Taibaiella sp. KBW10]
MKAQVPENLYCVYDTINLIERKYDQLLSIKELEAVSHYSYRNIQRIFKYSCGETIGAYQKRLRLEHAYKLMLYTKESLSAIALEVGFANLASFSKAFKQHFHISPKQAKVQKALLYAKAGLLPIQAEQILKPKIIYRETTTVYYESADTYYANEEIELLWQKFMSYEFPLTETAYFGLIADEPLIREALTCRYDACATQAPKHRQLPSKTIMGGRYAQFMHTGTYETIEDTYKKIYAGWILDTDLEFSHSPIIEQYIRHADNTDNEEDQLTAILLPLK